MNNPEFPILLPIAYLQIDHPIHSRDPSPKTDLPKNFLLPSAADLADSNLFADTYVSWSEKGLEFQFSFFTGKKSPSPASADNATIELFIDTRDVKSAGTTHKFCHHFIFHTSETDGPQALEITRFRTDDSHTPCDPSFLQLTKKSKSKVHLYLPSESLFGYDPVQFHRLGFTYRIKSSELGTQLFALSDTEYKIELHPALWGTLQLRK